MLRIVGVGDTLHTIRCCSFLPWGAIVAVVERHVADDVMQWSAKAFPHPARAAASLYADTKW